MPQTQRIGMLVLSGSEHARGVVRGVGEAAKTRRSWAIRLAGDIGGFIYRMLEWNPHGIITNAADDQSIAMLGDLGIPVVNFSGAKPEPTFPTVRIDDHRVGSAAAEYFLNLKLVDFAFWLDNPEGYAMRRKEGFFSALRAAGVADSHLHFLAPVNTLDWQARDRTFGDWMAGLPKPVGLLAGNDLQAYYLCDIARDIGLDIPNEIALLGVDNDSLICELATPSLSSMRIPSRAVGAAALAVLADLLEGRPAPTEPIRHPPRGIVSRGSTDMLAIDDADIVAAVRFIREHATEGISVPDVLRAVPLSRRTLERRFSEIFGRSPAAEIQRVQLERVKRLLENSNTTMSEVARQSGFCSAQYMAHICRKRMGMSPSRYRRRFRGVIWGLRS
jgi:LacI family transcriptional regulator